MTDIFGESNLKFTTRTLREGTTPTGGHIQMTQRSSGAFDVVAYDQENEIESRSKINMSLEDEDLGTGHYIPARPAAY
jgi:hypothetical protein